MRFLDELHTRSNGFRTFCRLVFNFLWDRK